MYTSIDRNGIAAFHPESGNKIWETQLSGVRGIDHVVATEKELFVSTAPDKFFVLDAITGRITVSSPIGDVGDSTFLIKDNVAYWQQWPLNLVATDLHSGEQNWTQSFEGGFEKTPVFAEGLVLVVTFGGQLFALHQPTGEIVWNTEIPNSLVHSERIVSNVTVVDEVVYYLTQDAQLRVVNMNTGELISTVEFTPSLFTLQTDVNNYRYDIAADNDLVAVYFGDSDQLFVFRFLPSE